MSFPLFPPPKSHGFTSQSQPLSLPGWPLLHDVSSANSFPSFTGEALPDPSHCPCSPTTPESRCPAPSVLIPLMAGNNFHVPSHGTWAPEGQGCSLFSSPVCLLLHVCSLSAFVSPYLQYMSAFVSLYLQHMKILLYFPCLTDLLTVVGLEISLRTSLQTR